MSDLDGVTYDFEFLSLGGGEFEFKVNMRNEIGYIITSWIEPMTRQEAEKLMFDMAFLLGYKVAT